MKKTIYIILALIVLGNIANAQTNQQDTALRSARESKFLKDYTSLNAAVSAIGNVQTELVVDENVNVTADANLPDNIHLKPSGNARFTLAPGRTLTIASADLGHRRYFFGSGKVLFAPNAVPELNLIWWTGNDQMADQTDAFTQALASMQSGGKLLIPLGNWRTSGNHIVPTGSIIEGVGRHPDSTTGSTVILTKGNALFKILGNTREVAIKDINIDGAYIPGATGILIEGDYPNSVFHIQIQVNFNRLTNGLKVNSLSDTAGGLQVEGLECNTCQFVENKTSFYINTGNSSTTFYKPLFQMPKYGIGMDILKSGQMEIYGHNAVSSSGSPPCVNNNPDPSLPTFIRVRGDHLPITIIGGQDEGIGYFLDTELYSYLGVVNLIGNGIQSIIYVRRSGVINATGNWLYRQAFRDASPTSGRIYAKGNSLQARNFCQDRNTPDNLDGDLDGGTLVLEQSSLALAAETKREYFNLLLNEIFLGNPQIPAMQVGTADANKILMRLGLIKSDNFTNYYDLKRNSTTGFLELENTGDRTPGLNVEGTVSSESIVAGKRFNYGGIDQPIQQKGNINIDPPRIAANSAGEQTFNLSGANVGDVLLLNPPANGINGGVYMMSSRVSGANQITVTFFNPTGGTVDASSGNWTFVLYK